MKNIRSFRAAAPGPSPALQRLQLGMVAYSRKEYPKALAHFDQAIVLAPRLIEAHQYRAYALAAVGDLAGALQSRLRVAALAPKDAQAQNEVGSLKGTIGDTEGALAHFDRAIALNPRMGEAHFNRARALMLTGRVREALESYDLAAELLPQNPDLHNNRGTLRNQMGDAPGALASYARAIELWPQLPAVSPQTPALLDLYAGRPAPEVGPARARHNRAVCLLSLGRLSEAWAEYEWRWFVNPGASRVFSAPQWRGEEPVEGKTILVHAEQGIGDSIQFSRYLPLLQARGARVLFGIRPREDGLRELFRGLGAPFEFVYWQAHARVPSYDYHCPMMSLPLAFGTGLQSIPPPMTPLLVPRERWKKWRKLIGQKGFRVGICWQGNPEHMRDKERSFPLALFSGIAAIPGVRLINLHKGAGESQVPLAPFEVENHNAYLSDGADGWLDTAGRLSQCDLVISCDTAIVHLAGTLGIPVWLALPSYSDWRWLRERDDSPWYASLRLFRQRSDGDWGSVFADLERRLRSMVLR